MMKSLKQLLILTLAVFSVQTVFADNYVIDKKGMHAAINFKIQHLGYSWLTGRFNDFDGTFSFDEKKPNASKITVNINPASVDSNHELRDKHLRNADFLDVAKFPKSSFVSTKVEAGSDGKLKITGDFTLHGVTRSIVIDATHIGGGQDPWKGFRHGFAGTTTIALKDYGINFSLGDASKNVELELYIEGIRQ